MDEKEYLKIEKQIHELVGPTGKFAGDVAEVLGVTFTMLKSLVKRSTKLDYRGHRIERVKE
jgi:predicted DNA-binding ArsR family transcriptional regulator